MIIGPDTLIIIFLGLATFFVAWWWFFVSRSNYLLDLTRQDLFNIRDELFNAAIRGEINFDNEAYKMMRTTLNGMIRFTEDISILHLSSIVLAHKYIFKGRRQEDYENRYRIAMRDLPESQKLLITKISTTAHFIIVRYVIKNSPVLWPVILPLFTLFNILKKTNELVSWALRSQSPLRPWPILDAEANYIARQRNRNRRDGYAIS